MKNIISYLLVVTFSLLSFQQAIAKGENKVSKAKSAGTYQVTSYGESCESVQYKLSQMQFLDKPVKEMLVDGGSSCVVVKFDRDNVTDAMAGAVCIPKGLNAFNPGNPQYISHITEKNVGTTTTNTLGYYFCLKNNKQGMCTDRKNFFGDKMSVTWKPTVGQTKGPNNGDCMCKRPDAKDSEAVRCPAEAESLVKGNSTECPIPGAKKHDDGQCRCINDESIIVKGIPQKCPDKPVVEQNIDSDFDECFADIQNAQKSCSTSGQDAIAKCAKEAPEFNERLNEAQRIMSIGLDALVAKGAAGGAALESCQKMSAAGTGVIGALDLFQKTCKKELESCKKGCEAVKAYKDEDISKMRDTCRAKFVKANEENSAKQWTTDHDARFAELAKQYQNGVDNAEKFCKGDVQVAEGQLQDFLDELATSVQKADICKCQLGAGSTGSGLVNDKCEAIVTPLTCVQNANQPGCSFSSVGCTPGSACDPNVKVANLNNTSGLAAPPSGFAGPSFSSAGGANSGKVQLGDDDFGGLYETRSASGTSATAAVDAGSPFGGVGGPGGGGGGGGGGGAPDPNAVAKEEGGEKNGLSGFFQNAKGAISSMFGGAAGDKAPAAKKDNKAYKSDVNGFRPKGAVRGMANAGEVGGKNRDIWKTMNERYTDQYHTFITVESPSK